MAVLLGCSAISLSGASPASSNWPQFRGPNSSGVALSAKPPLRIDPTNGALWKIDVPWSPSSPCVWGDRIFLTTFAEGQLQTRCHNCRDGQTLWSKGLKPEKPEVLQQAAFGERIFATPALVEDMLYLRTLTKLYAFHGKSS